MNIYASLREKLRVIMHKKGSNTKLGEEIGEESFASIEIDEYIGNENTINWMLGLIEHITKTAHVYWVL